MQRPERQSRQSRAIVNLTGFIPHVLSWPIHHNCHHLLILSGDREPPFFLILGRLLEVKPLTFLPPCSPGGRLGLSVFGYECPVCEESAGTIAYGSSRPNFNPFSNRRRLSCKTERAIFGPALRQDFRRARPLFDVEESRPSGMKKARHARNCCRTKWKKASARVSGLERVQDKFPIAPRAPHDQLLPRDNFGPNSFT
jgi:hypothetical protein